MVFNVILLYSDPLSSTVSGAIQMSH